MSATFPELAIFRNSRHQPKRPQLQRFGIARTAALTAVAALAMAVPAATLPSQTSPITALRFGALANPSGRTTPDAVILVQADTILRVDSGSLAIPAGARVIDLRRYTAIPGLMDVHTHMTYWRDKSNPTVNGPRAKDCVVLAAAENARKTLETGVRKRSKRKWTPAPTGSRCTDRREVFRT